MVHIAANELKKKGVSILESVLPGEGEAVITVRGRERFVVIDMETYSRFREYELETALAEARRDLAAGNFVEESVEDHIKRISNEL